MSNITAGRRATVAAIALVAAAGLTGCSQISSLLGGDPARDESGQITEAGDNSVFTLQVGDCLLAAASNSEVSEVPTVPCADEHDEEIVHLFDLPDGDFPDDETLDTLVYEGCDPAFTSYVGLDYEASAYDWYPITPSTDTWADGDREVICVAYADDASQFTGSLKGINQ